MTSESALPAESGAPPGTAAPANVAAHRRAELDRLRDVAATAAVLERARGAVMALTGCSPDDAGEELMRRAEAGGRTLLEECRLTLGGLVTPPRGAAPCPAPVSAAPGAPTPRPLSPGAPPAPAAPAVSGGFTALGRLGRALALAGTHRDLARCLLEHLTREVGADAVVIYERLPGADVELVAHAHADDTVAARWDDVPPPGGSAALRALRTREPQWPQDREADDKRSPLRGNPPERRPSHAWLPVLTSDTDGVCVGVLRGRGGPFGRRDREFLLGVARLCAGRLRALSGRREEPAAGAADTVRAVFDALPGAALLLTPLRSPTGEVEDFRVDAATRDTVDVLGRTGRELLGRRVLECFPGMAGEELWQGCLRTLATGEPYEGAPVAHDVPGAAPPAPCRVRVSRPDGGLVVAWPGHDPSDRQEQRLADVQRLGNLGWANWNLVTHEVNWSPQVFAVLERDPGLGPLRLTDLPAVAVPEDAPPLTRAVRELLRGGPPFDVPFRARTADGTRHLRFVAEAVADVHGAPVEVHGFLQDLTAQRNAELALVESERAILTQHGVLRAERSLAGRLQHALLPLPTRPVRLAGLRVEVAYLPAQSGLHVGGDWFSAIELPDGDALFVVGDVAGHGIDAVATMAQLRFTAKGMVITGSSLTGALARLNTLLLHSRDSHGSATMVLARYEPGERRLVWAQAGHPPPLLLRGGKARYLERPRGMLLGAGTSPVFEEAECRLEPGDRLLLYTDGLVERPTEGIDRGLARFAEAVVAHHTDLPGSLGPLLSAVLEGAGRDDVCVLDIRVPADGW